MHMMRDSWVRWFGLMHGGPMTETMRSWINPSASYRGRRKYADYGSEGKTCFLIV